jgi:restriction system protein
MLSFDPISLSPRDFELAVKRILDGSGHLPDSYESVHLQPLRGVDGEYTLDVTVRFSVLDADFLVLVECKHEKRKTERQDVQILHAKLHSIGAHKGMLSSTAGFQKGAIEYADIHGLALVQLASGESTYFTRTLSSSSDQPSWPGMPKYVDWWHHGKYLSVMSETNGEHTREALGFPVSHPDAI